MMEVQSINSEPTAGFRKVRLECRYSLRATISPLANEKLLAVIEDEITHELIHHTTTGDNAFEDAKQWIRDNLKL